MLSIDESHVNEEVISVIDDHEQVEDLYDDLYYHLELTQCAEISMDQPTRFTEHITGKLVRCSLDDPDEGIEIGSVSLYLSRLADARKSGLDEFDVLDSYSGDVAISLALFNDQEVSYEYGPHVTAACGEPVYIDRLLLVNSVSIQPEHRGHGLGLLALELIQQTYRTQCGLFVMCPFPIQFSGKVTDENLGEFKTAEKKLRRYWERAGFKRVPKSKLCVWASGETKVPESTDTTYVGLIVKEARQAESPRFIRVAASIATGADGKKRVIASTEEYGDNEGLDLIREMNNKGETVLLLIQFPLKSRELTEQQLSELRLNEVITISVCWINNHHTGIDTMIYFQVENGDGDGTEMVVNVSKEAERFLLKGETIEFCNFTIPFPFESAKLAPAAFQPDPPVRKIRKKMSST